VVVRLASSSVISALVASGVYYFLEGRKTKKERQIIHLKETIDQFYSPMLFHFEHMSSWGAFLGIRDDYAFDPVTLIGKLRDTEAIMRSGVRLSSPCVRNLWYEWQPLAVAAVEARKGSTYPQFRPERFKELSKALHQALKEECGALEKKYLKEIGGKP